jgi:hypothetical protein
MEYVDDYTKPDRLYLKGLAIRYEKAKGLWSPIMWHLALRGHTRAMNEFADYFDDNDSYATLGKPANAFSTAGLYRRAYRKGEGWAARNLALSYFNRNNMVGYRRWLKLAARAGDEESATELQHFETRLPHGAARRIRRLRPKQRRD